MKWGFTQADHDMVHRAMNRLGLEPMRGRFLDQLSGGERQKVMIARALAQQPKILLLDEPTSSLDIRNQHQVLRIVGELCRQDGLSAVMVIHDLSLALKFCDKFLLLRQGEVYREGGHEILDEQAFWDVYGVRARVARVGDHHVVLVED